MQVEQLKNKSDGAEEVIKGVKQEMASRINTLMQAVVKSDAALEPAPAPIKGKAYITKKGSSQNSEKPIPQLSVERGNSNAKQYVNHKIEIDSLHDLLLANREAIRRLKLEKKELLRTNFVILSKAELEFRNYENQGTPFYKLWLQAVHASNQESCS
jgi:CRISPR/Cas system CMR-associated protein Cmr1 (group 7 of RAMP superfamily)